MKRNRQPIHGTTSRSTSIGGGHMLPCTPTGKNSDLERRSGCLSSADLLPTQNVSGISAFADDRFRQLRRIESPSPSEFTRVTSGPTTSLMPDLSQGALTARNGSDWMRHPRRPCIARSAPLGDAGRRNASSLEKSAGRSLQSDSEVPRVSRPWFRFYVEAMRDPKMGRLTPTQRWLWVGLLAAARESCDPGYLMVADGMAYTLGDISRYADVPVREVEKGIDAMIALGMVAFDGESNAWFIPSWNDRQFESDDATLRSSQRRSLQQRSADATSTLATGNSVSVSVSVDLKETVFDRFYETYPLHRSKEAARKALEKALKKADIDTIVAGAERYRDDPNREQAFTKHPATWLNQECWEDDPLPARSTSTGRNPNSTRDRIREHTDSLRASLRTA